MMKRMILFLIFVLAGVLVGCEDSSMTGPMLLSQSPTLAPIPTPEPTTTPSVLGPTQTPNEPEPEPEPESPVETPEPEPPTTIHICPEPQLESVDGCYAMTDSGLSVYADITVYGGGTYRAFLMTRDLFTYEIKSETGLQKVECEDRETFRLAWFTHEPPVSRVYPDAEIAFIVTIFEDERQLAYVKLLECADEANG